MARILIFALAAVLSTPVASPQTHPSGATTLTAIEGAAFDRAFVAQMIQNNLDAAEELRHELESQHIQGTQDVQAGKARAHSSS